MIISKGLTVGLELWGRSYALYFLIGVSGADRGVLIVLKFLRLAF